MFNDFFDVQCGAVLRVRLLQPKIQARFGFNAVPKSSSVFSMQMRSGYF